MNLSAAALASFFEYFGILLTIRPSLESQELKLTISPVSESTDTFIPPPVLFFEFQLSDQVLCPFPLSL